MGTIWDLGQVAWRDYTIDDFPSSGAHEPPKSDIRAVITAIDMALGGPIVGQIVVAGVTRTIDVDDNGVVIVFTSDLPVTITLPASVATAMLCTFIPSGAGQLTVEEGAGATVECGLDQPGALHRKSAYRGGPMTAHMDVNVGGAAAHWWLYGATSPD